MGIELDKDYPIQPSPPLVSDRYGLRVLRQLSLEEMARLRPDGINDATHNLSQPFSLSDVINNLEETMHSGTRQDDPFFYGNRRLTYLKQIESLIPKDAKAVEEMGLANQQLGEFVNYLIQAVDIVGILTSERRIKAVAYNDKSFFIGNRGFQRFITPQEIDPVTGKLYDSGEFFCLETGHKLEIGPEDGNNIIRYGFYRKSPRTLALLAGHLEEPEDPVSRLALDPNLSVPISTYDQLDRLLNLIQFRGIKPTKADTSRLNLNEDEDSNIIVRLNNLSIPGGMGSSAHPFPLSQADWELLRETLTQYTVRQ